MNCLHSSRTPFKTCYWTLGSSWGRTYFRIIQLWLSKTICYLDGKKLTQVPRSFVFINWSTITVVLETHINLSCCLRCLTKLTDICYKIKIKYNSYSFIYVLSYLPCFSMFLLQFFQLYLPYCLF